MVYRPAAWQVKEIQSAEDRAAMEYTINRMEAVLLEEGPTAAEKVERIRAILQEYLDEKEALIEWRSREERNRNR